MFKVMAPFQPPPVAGTGSPFQWGSRTYVEELLDGAFDLRFEEGDAPQRGASGEEVWDLFSTVFGPTRTLAESLPPERREELRGAFIDFYERHRTDGGIDQFRPYLIVLGTRRA